MQISGVDMKSGPDSLTQEETEEIHSDQQLSPAVVLAVVVVVVVRNPAVPGLGCHTFLINQTALHLNRLAWFGCAGGIRDLLNVDRANLLDPRDPPETCA